MLLEDVFKILACRPIAGLDPSMPVARICASPESVRSEDVFVCFPEYHTYQQWTPLEVALGRAREVGPVLTISPEWIPRLASPQVLVSDTPRIAARLAKAWTRDPASSIDVFGVTGTNGKTTTTQLIAHLVERLGGRGAAMGTLGTFVGGALVRAGVYTTDLAVENFCRLRALADEGVGVVAMEVSSHGLALGRVAELDFKTAVLTHVTRDHLDFHGSLEAYKAAKKSLFTGLHADASAVLNADDACAAEFAAETSARVLTYGSVAWADWRLTGFDLGADGSRFSVAVGGEVFSGETALVGRFQLDNVLAAMAAVSTLGYRPGDLLPALAGFAAVRGRMERIALPNGASAMIDYAHNPDGLSKLLENCRALRAGRLLLVFGCGGDRDRGKRPLMAEAAERWCDEIWLTQDNPRTEDPGQIFADVKRGFSAQLRIRLEPDRRGAIEAALGASRPGDIVVIAGKGHEDYQIIGTTRHHFSDHEVVNEWISRVPPKED